MAYPSFLYNKQLSETEDNHNAMSDNVFRDLFLDREFRRDTYDILKKGCSPYDISARQSIFRLMIDDRKFYGQIEEISRLSADASILLTRIDSSSLEEEKILLFTALLNRTAVIIGKLAELSEYGGRAGEIGKYFSSMQNEPLVLLSLKRADDISTGRKSGIRVTVHGNDVRVADGENLTVDKLESGFVNMGIPEAVPADRIPVRANENIVKGYSEVYYEYYGLAKTLYFDYAKMYLAGEYDIHTLFGIHDELVFYIDVTSYFMKLKQNGFTLTFPEITDERKAVINGIVDASLYLKDIKGNEIVPNDVIMTDNDSHPKSMFYILTGANGGGKTTYLRACGIAALFFMSGCPITADYAVMMPFEKLFTHFPSDEDFESNGRFSDECDRADEIIKEADEKSFALFNETYSGTDERRSEDYSSRLADKMYEKGVFGIFVTHIHALTGGKIPTLAAVVDENDENRRTYKIKRVANTDNSYAADILEKYGLDRKSLNDRLESLRGERHG